MTSEKKETKKFLVPVTWVVAAEVVVEAESEDEEASAEESNDSDDAVTDKSRGNAGAGARHKAELEALELTLRHVEREVVEGPGDRRRVAFLVLLEVEQDLLGAGVSEDAFEHAEPTSSDSQQYNPKNR